MTGFWDEWAQNPKCASAHVLKRQKCQGALAHLRTRAPAHSRPCALAHVLRVALQDQYSQVVAEA